MVNSSGDGSFDKANETFERVRNLIVRETSIRSEKITSSSRFEEDLKIVGDDLIELVEAFFSHFEIITTDFDYKNYVSAEGFSLFSRVQSSPRTPMTVQMWVDAAIAGRWFHKIS